MDPLKALLLSKVIDDPPAVVVNEEVPLTVTLPLSVIGPADETDKVPPMVLAPRSMPLASAKMILFPDTIDRVEKLLPASLSVMLFALPAANVAVPKIVSGPNCMI